MKNIFSLGIKTNFYLRYNHMNGLVGALNGRVEQPA